MTLHAEEEMDADALTIFDVEHVILTGSVVERQKDRLAGEWKYLVNGESIPGDKATVVMICDICGQEGAQVRRVSRSYGRGADLFVIEDVPLVSCPHCSESYLTAATLHELERIKLHRRAMAQEHCIAVAAFAA